MHPIIKMIRLKAKGQLLWPLLISTLSIIYSAILVIYVHLHMHAAPLFGDEADKISQAANFFYMHNLSALDGAPYPPLIYFLSQPIFYFFGVFKTTAVAANVFFIPILILSIMYLCRHIGLSRLQGLAAALLTLFFPGVFALSRIYFQDFANTAMVAAAMAALVASKGFSSRKGTILFGIVAGFGMLTRANNVIFWLVPAFWVFGSTLIFNILWGNEEKKPTIKLDRFFINIAIGATIGLTLAGLWYFRNYPNVFNFGFSRVTQHPNMAEFPWHSKQSLLFFLYALIDYQISPLLVIPVIIFSLLAVIRYPKQTFPIFLWILVPYIFFIFPEWKLARYTAPMLPAFAILFIKGVTVLRLKWVYGILTALLVLTAMAQFTFFSIPGRNLSERKLIGNGILASKLLGIKMDHDDYQDDIPKPILDWDFHVAEVSRVLLDTQKQINKPGPMKVFCYGSVMFYQHEDEEPLPIVECGYFWDYMRAINNLQMVMITAGIDKEGKLFQEEIDIYDKHGASPESCDLITSYGSFPLESQGLMEKVKFIDAFQIPGTAEKMGFWVPIRH